MHASLDGILMVGRCKRPEALESHPPSPTGDQTRVQQGTGTGWSASRHCPALLARVCALAKVGVTCRGGGGSGEGSQMLSGSCCQNRSHTQLPRGRPPSRPLQMCWDRQADL